VTHPPDPNLLDLAIGMAPGIAERARNQAPSSSDPARIFAALLLHHLTDLGGAIDRRDRPEIEKNAVMMCSVAIAFLAVLDDRG